MPDILIVLVIILIVVVIMRGPKTLPKLGEALGRGVKEAKAGASPPRTRSRPGRPPRPTRRTRRPDRAMSGRFDGASTTPDDEPPDSSIARTRATAPARPRRTRRGHPHRRWHHRDHGWDRRPALRSEPAGRRRSAARSCSIGLNVVAIVIGVLIRNGRLLADLHQHRRDHDVPVPDGLPEPDRDVLPGPRRGRRSMRSSAIAPGSTGTRPRRRVGRRDPGRPGGPDPPARTGRPPRDARDRRGTRPRPSPTCRRCATGCCSWVSTHRPSASRPATTTRAGSGGRSGAG